MKNIWNADGFDDTAKLQNLKRSARTHSMKIAISGTCLRMESSFDDNDDGER